jgi:hypothetical protein
MTKWDCAVRPGVVPVKTAEERTGRSCGPEIFRAFVQPFLPMNPAILSNGNPLM